LFYIFPYKLIWHVKFQAAATIESILTKDKRGHIVLNLWETEKNYLKDLTILEESCKRGLIERQILSDTAVSLIFSHTESLMTLHQRFGKRLDEIVALGSWSTTESRIGKLFIEFGEEFTQAYRRYIEGYAVSRKQLSGEIKTNTEFQQFIEEKRKEHQWKLDDLLVLPVQRTTRYHLLLKDLVKETPDTHPDKFDLQQGWTCMRGLAESVNDQKRRADESMGLFVAFEQTKNCPVTLVNAKRRMIAEYDIIDQKTHKIYHLFLCSDLLMITSVIENSYFKKRGDDNKKYKFIRWIDLTELLFEDLGENVIALIVDITMATHKSLTTASADGANQSMEFKFDGPDAKKNKTQFLISLEAEAKRCKENGA
jgi:hypothetical protein